MKFFLVVLAPLLSVVALAVPPSNEPAPRRIWIADVTIVSPENLPDLARGSVRIENERIARVERDAKAKPPAGAKCYLGGRRVSHPRSIPRFQGPIWLRIELPYVHGGFTPWVSDGGPFAWFAPDGSHGESFINNEVLNPTASANEAEYYYTNDQSARW